MNHPFRNLRIEPETIHTTLIQPGVLSFIKNETKHIHVAEVSTTSDGLNLYISEVGVRFIRRDK